MDVRSDTAILGFLSRSPQLKRVGDDDLPLFVGQLGQKHYRREDDGTFTLTDTSFIELVMIGTRAEAAITAFTKGDDVVALGEFKTRTFEQHGQKVERLQFRATRLLFDTSHPRYVVSRTPREAIDDTPPSATAGTAAVEFRAPHNDSALALGR